MTTNPSGDNYANQSKKAREKATPKASEEKTVVKPLELEGTVTMAKPSLGQRFKKVFMANDFRIASKYVTADVILPAVRRVILDAIVAGTTRVLYGDNRPPGSHSRSFENSSRVTYSSPLQRQEPMGMPGQSFRSQVMGSYPTHLPDQPPHPYRQNVQEAGQIVLSSKHDAEQIIEQMIEMIDVGGVVTVGDLYAMIGQPTTPISEKWGWTALGQAQVAQVHNGYQLVLPQMQPLQ